MMNDNDDEEAKLNEEIEAELEKISISSLEKYDDSDSKSETQSDDSDSDLVELPNPILDCINTIKQKSNSAEELILQDLEDTDDLGCNYGAVSNDQMHLRIELPTEYKDNPRQLMKILAEIEKEEFMRSKIHCDRPDSVLELCAQALPMDEHSFPDDLDINFGYCEVEERCRQSFEAWQDKQKELEDQEQEILKKQREKERTQFQEEEEKRYCWMKQFEIEKKKLEDIYKQEQNKINEELHTQEEIWKEKFKQHEEFIRNLNLQMEEERTRFKDQQEKEIAHLLKVKHNAAMKIQATYKAFVIRRKYGSVIKEQLESKKKAQEWKEKETKIRKIEEEKFKILEEKQKIEKEIRKQKAEERKERIKEYEGKKNLLRQVEGQPLNKEKLGFKEDASKQLVISSTLKQEGDGAKYLTVTGTVNDKDNAARSLEDRASEKWEQVPLWLVEELKSRENGGRQNVLKESQIIKLDDSISSKTIFTEFKMEEKLGKLAKQQCSGKLVKQETECKNTEPKYCLQNQNLKENAIEQFQLQELKSQTQKEKAMKTALAENISQETQITILGHNKAISEVGQSEQQKIIQDNQHTKILKVEQKVITDQNRTSDKENVIVTARKQKTLPLKLEKSEVTDKSLLLQNIENDSKSEETGANPQNNGLNNDIIFYTSADAVTQLDGNINKQDISTPCNDVGGCVTNNALIFREVNSLMSERKNITEPFNENKSACENIMTCSLPETALLLVIKEKRLAWKKSFKPWLEIFKQNQQKKIVRRKRPIKCQANIMPPLNMIEILQCGPWNDLKQVTTVMFQDLPGCSLSTLAECSNLQFLCLRRCGLTSLDSLNNCKKLKYIDAQENHIETVNCENLENLCVVLLNRNQLTSLHGFDGCVNIQSLELSHNKITRIAGLESLKNLQQLIVNHNQLISTKGLSDSPAIIYLDCSYNNLTEVEGIENCGLLQILKLQGNYLSELPPLENHVLLRELHLDDNSISTVEAFSSYWLPLLQNLTLSQNSLTKIIPLFHLISLEKLDVSNNCLSDLTSAKSWFESCYSLRELSLTGNPLLQEINWRHFILKILPALRILNGEMLNSYLENHMEESYQPEFRHLLEFSQSQIRELNSLAEDFNTGNGYIFTLDAAENRCLYFKKMMTLSNEYRFAHEQHDGNLNKGERPEAQHKHATSKNSDRMLQTRDFESGVREYSPDSPDIAEKRNGSDSVHTSLAFSSFCEGREGRSQEIIDQETEDSNKRSLPTKQLPSLETGMTNSLLSDCQNIEYHDKIMAARVIQAYWRGYIERKLTSRPDSYIKNHIILKMKEKENIENFQDHRENAAILIQAVWKGFLLRKKLATALEAIKSEESEEEYEEIDLEDFTFDEAALEKEWLASDSAGFPSKTLLLPNQLHWPKFSGTLKCDDTSLCLPSHPAQAWLSNEKENSISSEHTLLNSRLEDRSFSWTPESKTSRKSLLKSEKEEKISEEWGFKDISTAQQMLKRARKMKATKSRKNLDPTVRLALFKNNENKVSLIKSPKKAPSSRDSHLAGKEEFIYKDTFGLEKVERSKEYTYQWLHTQVKVHETSSRNMKGEHFLPELDPDIRNGGRVQLVARLVSREDTDLDRFSMTSGSALSVKREKKNQAHRHSAGSSSFSVKGVVAPKITNTRSSKKERISFRDSPLQLSGGWGSGKRMTTTSN